MTSSVVPQRHRPATTTWLRVCVAASHLTARLRRRVAHGPRDAGDVPGWVLVTIMTAGLVVALWAVAGPKLGELFGHAVDSVKGP